MYNRLKQGNKSIRQTKQISKYILKFHLKLKGNNVNVNLSSEMTLRKSSDGCALVNILAN